MIVVHIDLKLVTFIKVYFLNYQNNYTDTHSSKWEAEAVETMSVFGGLIFAMLQVVMFLIATCYYFRNRGNPKFSQQIIPLLVYVVRIFPLCLTIDEESYDRVDIDSHMSEKKLSPRTHHENIKVTLENSCTEKKDSLNGVKVKESLKEFSIPHRTKIKTKNSRWIKIHEFGGFTIRLLFRLSFISFTLSTIWVAPYESPALGVAFAICTIFFLSAHIFCYSVLVRNSKHLESILGSVYDDVARWRHFVNAEVKFAKWSITINVCMCGVGGLVGRLYRMVKLLLEFP